MGAGGLELLHDALEVRAGIALVANERHAPGTAEERLQKQAAFAKQALEKSVESARELFELAGKTQTEAFEVLNKRFTESLDEMTSLVKKETKKEGKVVRA